MTARVNFDEIHRTWQMNRKGSLIVRSHRFMALSCAMALVCSLASASGAPSVLAQVKAMTEEQLFRRIMVAFEAAALNSPPTEAEAIPFSSVWNELLEARGAKADPYVLKLMYYYGGETSLDPTVHSLYCRRARVLPALRNMKKTGPQCEPQYANACFGKETWDDVLLVEINKILAGKTGYKDSSCPQAIR